MSAAGHHVIRRTSVEVTGGVKADAFRFHQEVAEWTRNQLLPELESVFALLPDDGTPIVVDRLELELQSLNPRSWGADALARLRSELLAALSRQIVAARQNKPAIRLTGFLGKLAHYLENGVLPWTMTSTTRATFEREFKEWLASKSVNDLRPLLVERLKTRTARSRFVAVLSAGLVREVLTAVFAVPEKVWDELVRDFEILSGEAPSRFISAPSIHESAEAQPRPGTPVSPSRQVSPQALARELLEALAAASFVYNESVAIGGVKSILKQLADEGRIDAATLSRVPLRSTILQRGRDAVLSESSAVFSKPGVAAPGMARTQEPPEIRARAERRERPAVEGIFIENAGLILLAPFLNLFFERVGIAVRGELQDPAMAMALLHYLATGEENPVEFHVVLPKVLCGWEIEQPIDLPSAIPEAMKNESRDLLKSVIEHWAILKETSVESLQEAFLRRQGKISLRENGDWLLQVEQRAFDMLIQELPWSFSLVKLPWMKKLLQTEWVS